MTSEPVNPSPEARERMDAYLDAIERVLVAADMPRAERKGIADDVEAQILEMLAARGCATPSVEDVETVLSDLDPPEAYAEGGGAPPGAPAAASPAAPPRRSARPHFSRAAIVGACWAPVALILIVPLLMHAGYRAVAHEREKALRAARCEARNKRAFAQAQAAEEERTRPGTQPGEETTPETPRDDPFDGTPPPDGTVHAEARGSSGNAIAIWAVLLMVPLGLVGLSAPFGTTILGIVAISHIRRSAGRIYGMGLALFDALLFPLIVLDGLMVLCAALLGTGVDGSLVWGMVVGLVFAVVADVVIVRLLWRRVSAPAGDAR